MIEGYLENELYDTAVLSFKCVLREESLSPDDDSYLRVLDACANTGGDRLVTGKQIHGFVIKSGLEDHVKNTLMDTYHMCGSVEDAMKLFIMISNRDVVTWNVRTRWLVLSDNFKEACEYFWMARKEGVSPDEESFSTALHACANTATPNQGVLIHSQVIQTGFLTDVCISSALVTMYGKCATTVDAHKVFEEIVSRKNVICWTAMIAAYQQHGCADQALELFEKMLRQGIEPEHTTFVYVLSACGHTGKVEQGFSYFNSMVDLHRPEPGSEHYVCMVDLLGRAGRLEEAIEFIESMLMKPGPLVWASLLVACRNHMNLEIGRAATEKLFELEPTNSGNYVMLVDMYAQEADEIRRLMEKNGVRKEPGCSWIDVKNYAFAFNANDRSHSRTYEVYEMLTKMKALFTKKGYMPAVNDAEE